MIPHSNSRISIVLIVIAALCYLGCQPPSRGYRPKADAVAVLMPTEGNIISGVAAFSRVQEGVRVIVDVTGLAPGAHGIHVHAYGDCRAADGSSAGDHFNPLDNPHGAPDDEKRHMGDLGNLTADDHGVAVLDIIDSRLTLDGEHSIIGRSVVVHAQADDFTTQPHGAAGARLACGVIGIARK